MSDTIGLKLSEIMIDPALETRTLDPEWVRHLEEGVSIGEKPDPMTVTRAGGVYVLIGGHHRYEMWRRVLGADARVVCRVVECADFNDMMRAALADNRKNAKPYTERERNALYYRLTREMGWNRKDAKAAIGISDDRAERYESRIITMPATERADGKETPTTPERAIGGETPAVSERAEGLETPRVAERAKHRETPIDRERARGPEPPKL